MGSSDLAYYLYCLTPSSLYIQGSAVGTDGLHPISSCTCGAISAVYSEVELREFLGESAEAHVQDLAWLGPSVCRHEAVIERIMTRAPVLPARFATLFSSLDSLEQFLLEQQETITGFFRELGDQQEWAVKGLVDRTGALERLSYSAVEGLASSPGTRYFQEKRIKAQLEREFNQSLKVFCRRAAAALGKYSSGFRERKVLAPAAGGNDAEVVLNWAFLIPPLALNDFRTSLERFNDGQTIPGLMLTLTAHGRHIVLFRNSPVVQKREVPSVLHLPTRSA